MKTPKKSKSEKFLEDEPISQKKLKVYPKSKRSKLFDDEEDDLEFEDFNTFEDLDFEEEDDEF